MYAIHCSSLASGRDAAAEAMKATKLGFCYPGFVFGPLWLATKRLWLALFVYVLVAALFALLAASGLIDPGAVVVVEILAAIFIGLEGRHWLAFALARRGLPLVDIVEARNEDEAARVYFARALTAAAAPPAYTRSVAPRAPSGIIGSFPEALR